MTQIILFGTPSNFSTSDLMGIKPEFLSKYNGTYSGTVSKQAMDVNGSHYILLIYPETGKQFLDANGNPGGFLGIDLVVPNKQILNPTIVRSLLIKTYDSYIKNKLVKETADGDRQFMISSLQSQNNKIANDVHEGMMKIINANPEFDIFNVNPNMSVFDMMMANRGQKL